MNVLCGGFLIFFVVTLVILWVCIIKLWRIDIQGKPVNSGRQVVRLIFWLFILLFGSAVTVFFIGVVGYNVTKLLERM